VASKRVIIELKSTESSHFYTTTINPRTQTGKLETRKYDPKLGRHVLYKQKKVGK
jgi:large subunit ribosomal protein L33